MPIVKYIKNHFKYAVISRCYEKKCELCLGDLVHYVILKGEKISQNYKICDCIIFTDNFVIGLIELKSRTTHANEIVEKFNNALKIVINILKKYKNSKLYSNISNYRIYLLVLAKRWRSPELSVFARKKINIRGRKHFIFTKRCGTNFSRLIES